MNARGVSATSGSMGVPLHGAAIDDALLPGWALTAAREWDIGRLIERIVEADVEAAFPDRAAEVGFADLLRGSARENLQRLQEYVTGQTTLDEITLVKPIEFASAQAQLGIPQSALLHSYRVGFLTIWDDWTGVLQMHAQAAGADLAQVNAVLRLTTARIFTYQDFVSGRVAASYIHREEALRRSGEQMRQQLVRELLCGQTELHSEDAFLTLGYDLSVVHLVVRLPGISDVEARRLAAQLRTAAGATNGLTVRMTATDTVIWLARPRTWSAERMRALRSVLEEIGHTAAISQPARGLAGFRSGHAETLQVEAVRKVWRDAPAVLEHGDIQLEALLIADLTAARQFVAHELGPLAADSDQAARFRETLLTSFATASHIATAERLGLHEHTVRNRLQRAEQLLGRKLTERRVELQVALRLCRLLGPPDLDEPESDEPAEARPTVRIP